MVARLTSSRFVKIDNDPFLVTLVSIAYGTGTLLKYTTIRKKWKIGMIFCTMKSKFQMRKLSHPRVETRSAGEPSTKVKLIDERTARNCLVRGRWSQIYILIQTIPQNVDLFQKWTRSLQKIQLDYFFLSSVILFVQLMKKKMKRHFFCHFHLCLARTWGEESWWKTMRAKNSLVERSPSKFLVFLE